MKNEELILTRMVGQDVRQAQKLAYEMFKYGWNPRKFNFPFG